MSRIPVCDKSGAPAGDMEIDDGLLVFDRGDTAVRDVVVAQMAARRAGTASTRTKAEVAGSGQKPWRQKGLGRARAGYRQSPVWRGGGVTFGPKPRSYRKKVPKNVASLAFRRAFSEKISSGAVRVLEEISIEEPKTRLLAAMLKSMNLAGKTLVMMDKPDRNVMLAARNMPDVTTVDARMANTYQILRHSNILVTRAAMPVLENRLGRGKKK